MAIEVKMPKLSDTMEEGTILQWFKREGEPVHQGEPLVEVETDKADMEVEAETSGVLTEILVKQGEMANVGAVIAVLDRAPKGPEATGDTAPPAPAGPAGPSASGAPAAKPAAPARETAPSALPPEAKPTTPPARPVAAPVPPQPPTAGARAPVTPTPSARAPVSPTPAAAGRRAAAAPTGRHDVSKLRATIAKQMSSSKREVPHFYVTSEIDMSEAARLRATLLESGALADRITVTHLLIRGLVLALQRHPRLNAAWADGAIVYHDDINIGVAVAVEDGLIAPVVRRCQEMSLAQIAHAVSDLVGKAQTGKFSGDELTGATFTLSNLGMLDIEEFSAVITQPQAAILAVGAIKDRAVVRAGQLTVAKTMRVTLSCDHRVLNGMEAGRFLEDLKRTLEHPVLLVIATT